MLPTINTFHVDRDKFGLYWKASPLSNIRGWNLYAAPQVTIDFIPPNKGVVLPGVAPAIFTQIRTNLPNVANEMTPGSCFVEITRAELGIGPLDPYHFLITSLTEVAGVIVESAMEVPNVHACPFYDDQYVDEAGWPCNLVYREFEVDLWPLTGWDPDRYLDIVSLLGRPARQIKVDSVGSDIYIKFNSIASDTISVRDSQPYQFDLKRGELMIYKIFVHNPTVDDATIRVFVAA